MREFNFACLNLVAAEQNFEEIEELLDTLAQTCDQFDEPERSILLSALQTNGLKLIRPVSSGLIFDLIEWAKTFALIEVRSEKVLDFKAIESIILVFVRNLSGGKIRIYADDGSNIVSFVNTRTSSITLCLRSNKDALVRQFKEERA